MGFSYSPKIHVFGVNFWVVSNQFMMEVWLMCWKIWTSKGVETVKSRRNLEKLISAEDL